MPQRIFCPHCNKELKLVPVVEEPVMVPTTPPNAFSTKPVVVPVTPPGALHTETGGSSSSSSATAAAQQQIEETDGSSSVIKRRKVLPCDQGQQQLEDDWH
jgi:hypothetical protein